MNPFPNVAEGITFFPKSDATPNYNCIAWAVTYEQQAIWPDDRGQMGWPIHLPREETPAAFQAFFESAGFVVCSDGTLEAGHEKIAIYVLNGLVTHAARQLPNGRWTSKMAQGVDAEHPSPDTLVGPGYGYVRLYMRRRYDGRPPLLPPLNPLPPLIIRP
ncbi:hypothetical protein [Bradyrhizobium sp. SZCCHNR1051]|uniref:DUF7689 domain-containing protein n=1 Tax=Bradyrhizobium sp. SZCCHNR1051 TaxID=3057355 RepID=UPI00291671D2|nr:hypothetical protein [Bradyrhizobium sp. SZCCHNR1051]